jgi:hypothetical protein
MQPLPLTSQGGFKKAGWAAQQPVVCLPYLVAREHPPSVMAQAPSQSGVAVAVGDLATRTWPRRDMDCVRQRAADAARRRRFDGRRYDGGRFLKQPWP